MLRFDHRGFLRVHGGFGRFRRRYRLIVLLLRNLVLGDQCLVALDILRGFVGIGFGHFDVGLRQTQTGLRDVLLLLCVVDGFGRILPRGLRAIQRAAGGRRRQRHVAAGSLQIGELVIQIGFGALDRDFEILGIEFHQNVALLHHLPVLHQDLDPRARPRAR